MTTKEFHIGTVLSISHDILLSPDHMNGVQSILDFMTGDSLYTHQLPRASRECEPAILAQHPQLRDITIPKIEPREDRGESASKEFLDSLYPTYGEYLSISPLNPGDHTRIDPLLELSMINHQTLIIPIKTP